MTSLPPPTGSPTGPAAGTSTSTLAPDRPGASSLGTPWPPPNITVAPPTGFGPAGFAPEPDDHPTLPLVAGVGAIVVLTVSLVASKVALDLLVDQAWPLVTYVALLSLLGYGPSMLWCWYASRRWGSGSLVADTGFRPRWSDLGWGPVVWLSAVGVQIVLTVLVLVLQIPIENNTDGISELAADRTYAVSIVIAAVVAAPLVEEVVFRGVVMRAFLSRMPLVLTIALQAVLFGAAHVDPARGAGNIGLVIVLSGVGAVFGGAAYLLRRIGPTVLAHAIFNGVAMALLLSGVAERLAG